MSGGMQEMDTSMAHYGGVPGPSSYTSMGGGGWDAADPSTSIGYHLQLQEPFTHTGWTPPAYPSTVPHQQLHPASYYSTAGDPQPQPQQGVWSHQPLTMPMTSSYGIFEAESHHPSAIAIPTMHHRPPTLPSNTAPFPRVSLAPTTTFDQNPNFPLNLAAIRSAQFEPVQSTTRTTTTVLPSAACPPSSSYSHLSRAYSNSPFTFRRQFQPPSRPDSQSQLPYAANPSPPPPAWFQPTPTNVNVPLPYSKSPSEEGASPNRDWDRYSSNASTISAEDASAAYYGAAQVTRSNKVWRGAPLKRTSSQRSSWGDMSISPVPPTSSATANGRGNDADDAHLAQSTLASFERTSQPSPSSAPGPGEGPSTAPALVLPRSPHLRDEEKDAHSHPSEFEQYDDERSPGGTMRARKPRRRNGEPPRDLAQRKYICELCPVEEAKSFARPSALKIHMLTHTKEKPHFCPVCSRAFAISSNLKRHLRLHANRDTAARSLQK